MPLSTVLGAQSLIKPGVCTTATRPASPYTGQAIYDTTTATQLIWNGTAWVATGRIVQVVMGNTSTQVSSTSASLTDTGLTATITPTTNTSKILVMVAQNGCTKIPTYSGDALLLVLLRGATAIATGHGSGFFSGAQYTGSSVTLIAGGTQSINWLDSPATTSATTYKTQFKPNTSPAAVVVQSNAIDTSLNMSTIILMEVLA